MGRVLFHLDTEEKFIKNVTRVVLYNYIKKIGACGDHTCK